MLVRTLVYTVTITGQARIKRKRIHSACHLPVAVAVPAEHAHEHATRPLKGGRSYSEYDAHHDLLRSPRQAASAQRSLTRPPGDSHSGGGRRPTQPRPSGGASRPRRGSWAAQREECRAAGAETWRGPPRGVSVCAGCGISPPPPERASAHSGRGRETESETYGHGFLWFMVYIIIISAYSEPVPPPPPI